MQQTDILIIGGGIAGASTAYYLARYGHEVTLLERGQLASEASGLNAGTFWTTGWSTAPDLSTTLSMGSREIFQTLQFELGQDIEFRQSGSLKIIQTDEQYAFVREEVAALTAQGHSVELLSTTETRTIEPTLSQDIIGSLYYPYGGNANPVKATRAFALLAQQQGATILINHNVIALSALADGTYEVKTASEIFQARKLVLAAGPWCSELGAMLGLAIPVYAVRGQMWAVGPVPQRLFHSISATESALYWHNHPFSDEQHPLELTHHGGQRLTRHLYGQQTQAGELIFGGDREVGATKVPDQAGIAVNQQHVSELFPFLRDLPIRRTWAGWMPFTRDLRPLIGKIPQCENLYLVTGLSSSGFEQGPMAGRLLADCIHQKRPVPILKEAEPANVVEQR